MDRADLELWTGREVARLVALLEAERRHYQEVLASLPIAAMVVSGAAGVISANRTVRRLLNLRPEELHSRKIGDVLPSAQIEASVEETLARGATHSGIPVEIAGRTLVASILPVVSWEENSERDAIVVLEESKPAATTRSMGGPSSLPAVLWSLNPSSMQFESVEGADDHLLGYSREHWLSTPEFWIERIHADDRPGVRDLFRSAFSRGGDFSCEYRALAANGRSLWRRDVFRVMLGEASRPARVVGLTIDANPRRQADLENVMANRVDALVGLSRRLSHQLNNSLMVVTGYAEELLTHLGDTDSRRADVRAILSAAEAMAGVTGELHGFTRKQAAPSKLTDISTLLTSVSARIREELGATLVLRLPHDRIAGFADSVQLEAVLMSIARKLRDRLDPHMIVAARETWINESSNLTYALKPGRYAEIALRGPYASEVPLAAFESFLSGKDPHGSDMARAMAIVRDWGGAISSDRGDHYSEVRILLPSSTSSTRPTLTKPEPPPVQPEPVEHVEPSAATVLLVEDESGIRALVRKILTREGYVVVDAATAEAAVELVKERRTPIQLLIADVNLPGKNGRELADALLENHPAMRVMYISGFTDDPAALTQRLGTGAALLQKPFTLAALTKKVREVLG